MYLDTRLRIHRTDTVWKATEVDSGKVNHKVHCG